MIEPTFIEFYVMALNIEILRLFKDSYVVDPLLYPQTLNAMMLHANAFYSRQCAVDPQICKILGNTQGFAVYATEEIEDDEEVESIASIAKPASPSGRTGITCQLCGKQGHVAVDCRTLKDAEAVKKYVAGGNFMGPAQRRSMESKPTSPTEGTGSQGVGMVTLEDDPSMDNMACAVGIDGDQVVLCCAIKDDGLVDWEHDDHADVHVVRDDAAAEFFDTFESNNCRLLGFASDMTIRVQGRGLLIRDMGTGVRVLYATKNLMSAVQLRKAYTRMPTDSHRLKYVHNVDRSVITFRLEKDGYYHTRLDSGQQPVISAVDFYNPPSLMPVDPA
jgi:hypothetical protein